MAITNCFCLKLLAFYLMWYSTLVQSGCIAMNTGPSLSTRVYFPTRQCCLGTFHVLIWSQAKFSIPASVVLTISDNKASCYGHALTAKRHTIVQMFTFLGGSNIVTWIRCLFVGAIDNFLMPVALRPRVELKCSLDASSIKLDG